LPEGGAGGARSGPGGVAFACACGDGPVFVEAAGLARIAPECAATAATAYPWFSVTKLFTATAVLQLAEKGEAAAQQPDFGLRAGVPPEGAGHPSGTSCAALGGEQRQPARGVARRARPPIGVGGVVAGELGIGDGRQPIILVAVVDGLARGPEVIPLGANPILKRTKMWCNFVKHSIYVAINYFKLSRFRSPQAKQTSPRIAGDWQDTMIWKSILYQPQIPQKIARSNRSADTKENLYISGPPEGFRHVYSIRYWVATVI
jgi:hypothetical protein